MYKKKRITTMGKYQHAVEDNILDRYHNKQSCTV